MISVLPCLLVLLWLVEDAVLAEVEGTEALRHLLGVLVQREHTVGSAFAEHPGIVVVRVRTASALAFIGSAVTAIHPFQDFDV